MYVAYICATEIKNKEYNVTCTPWGQCPHYEGVLILEVFYGYDKVQFSDLN